MGGYIWGVPNGDKTGLRSKRAMVTGYQVNHFSLRSIRTACTLTVYPNGTCARQSGTFLTDVAPRMNSAEHPISLGHEEQLLLRWTIPIEHIQKPTYSCIFTKQDLGLVTTSMFFRINVVLEDFSYCSVIPTWCRFW